MALAALIAAYHESREAGGQLRAALPLGGRTLLERQARLARAAGAGRIVLVVERLPGDLLAAIDRLRRSGLTVTVARSANEAAEAVDASDRLLLIGDGFLGDESHVRRVTHRPGPAVLILPDSGVDDRFERIDAASRWAGVATLDGASLRETASMLRDWDLQSTLLRRLIQNGAERVTLDSAGADLTIVLRYSDLADVQRKALDRPVSGRGSWVSRYLLGPVERAATRFLMQGKVSPATLGIAATVLTGFGALAFATNFLWVGMLLMLLATPFDGVADRLARLRLDQGASQSWWSHILPALSGAGLVALAYTLADTAGWGCVVLALTTIAFMLAERIELEEKDVRGIAWLAERKGMTWAGLPFAATGLWVAGLAFLFAYSAGSFFWAQRQVHMQHKARQD